jgi:xanthine/uracil permease
LTLPNTAYAQNVGLITLTGVVSRHVVTIGGILLICMGLFPKLGGLVLDAILPGKPKRQSGGEDVEVVANA